MKLYLIFDGGSNSIDGAYGSFIIRECKACRDLIHKRVKFGEYTNNQAEYMTLITALEQVIWYGNMHTIPTDDIQITIEGDSNLVRCQVGTLKYVEFNHLLEPHWSGWKVNVQHLLPLRDRARGLLQQFKSFTYSHVPREEVVFALGH